MSKLIDKILIAAYISLCLLVRVNLSQAQPVKVVEDGTLSTNVNSPNGLDFTITGGKQVERNLFHSFKEFSVPTKGSAIFNNGLDIQNIFSRVTGNFSSKIDGSIETSGTANLFLINPNGIIFGANAKLDIGGSFIASTSEQILFSDGTFFTTTDSQQTPLLTISPSMPIGLQFKERALSIENRAVGDSSAGLANIQVKPNTTIALVGGEILFTDRGSLLAPGGSIEIGSVASKSLVTLTPVATGWTLGYENTQSFQDIQLSGQAYISVSDRNLPLTLSSGSIRLQGRKIALTGGSNVFSFNTGIADGRSILIKASESVEVSDSNISAIAFSTGTGGDIKIETNRLLVNNNSISTIIGTQTYDLGSGGNLVVEAESVEIDGGGGLSQLRTQSLGVGKSGNLTVKTEKLTLRNGGQLSSRTIGSGNGGTINVIDSKSVKVSGQGILGINPFSSGLFSTTSSEGNGGDINISTERLVVRDGARLSVAALPGSTGQAGRIQIKALELVEVNGAGSALLTTSESSKPAGDLSVNTPLLMLQHEAKISASSPLSQGGNINLQGLNFLQITNGSEISATTEDGQAGNVQVNQGQIPANSVYLNEGSLTAKATGTGDSGNLTVNARVLNLQNNSEVSASTQNGRAGNLTINAAESVQLTSKSNLSVEATADGTAGNLSVETQQMKVSDGAKVSVSSPKGQAGNLTITANSLTLDRGAITAETGKSGTEEGANISLQLSDLLKLDKESLISATANGDADGGNININSPLLAVFSPTGANGSDIIAKAERGNGGNIRINAQGIFGIAERAAIETNRSNDIDASSQFGASGQVQINNTIDPNQGITQLPETVVDPNALVAQNPCKRGSRSQFSQTGRGGLPPTSNEDLSSEATQVGLVEPAPSRVNEERTKRDSGDIIPAIENPIVPAQGWIFNEKGEVVLTTYNPTVTGTQRLKENPAGCLAY